MMSLFRKVGTSNDGAVAIEFSMALPVILLLTYAFFEFSLVLFTQAVLNSSAEEATRFAMVSFERGNFDPDYIAGIESEIEDVAKDSFVLIDENNISDFDVDVVTNADSTLTVNINIDYAYKFMMPLTGDFSFTMTGASKSFLVQ